MRGCGLLLTVSACLTFAACDEKFPPSPNPGPPSQSAQLITGGERLGWDQPAANASELRSFRYALYIDGARVELADAICDDTRRSQGFACSARLPAMPPGAHTLELAAFVVDGGVLESGKSESLSVFVSTSASQLNPAPTWGTGEVIATADDIPLRLEMVAAGLDEPLDLGFASDGRVFVAEKSGRISIVRDDHLESSAVPDGLADDRAFLALAIDPQFQRTGLVYALYAARTARGSTVFQLARFREADGIFAERAIIVEDLAASSVQPAAVLRFGSDQKLYAVLDDADSPQKGGDPSSYSGKILRFNADGTTPRDQPSGTPIYAHAVQSPRGLDWQPSTGTLWVADAADRSERLDVVVDESSERTAAIIAAKYSLPPMTGMASLAFYRGTAIPAFRGDLFIAAAEGRHILRLQFDRTDGSRIIASERLLEDVVGPVRAVAVSPRGEVYFCAGNSVGRLVPQS